MSSQTRFVVRGCRANTPVVPPGTWGIHTTCYTVETPEAILILDAGSGIASLHEERSAKPPRPATLLLTHTHLDHINGLAPFLSHYLHPGHPLRILTPAEHLMARRAGIRSVLAPPLWPVPWRLMRTRLKLEALPPPGKPWDFGPIQVTWCPAWHPQGGLAVRLQTRTRTVVVATDREPGKPDMDRQLRALCRGADDLLLDAQYTPEEARTRQGWGHGTWEDAAAFARDAGVKRLFLIHHDPTRTDAALRRIVRAARRIFPATRAAREGLAIRM
jgi:ribonuclease BN (tRNA processing enzyme)